jgi:hypothetical protein
LGLTHSLHADRQYAASIDIGSVAAAGQHRVNAVCLATAAGAQARSFLIEALRFDQK